jgi:energy-coupling factor transporter transmembrane protein EcfT
MAQILTFHYQPGSSLLHRSDPRVKFILYLAWNISLGSLGLQESLAISLLLVGLMGALGIPILRLMGELRALIWIFLITWLSRAHLSGGVTIAILQEVLPFALNIPWNSQGALLSLRFMVQIAAALASTHILMATTALPELQEGLYRLLRLVHRGFAWRLSTMIRIMLSAIPGLMDAAAQGRSSLKMRALNARRQPILYIKGMGTIMLKAVRRLAGGYAEALTIRAWQPDGPATMPAANLFTGVNLIVGALGIIPLILIGILFELLR